MENNNEKYIKNESVDKGPLWAILLTIGMIIVMAMLSRYVG